MIEEDVGGEVCIYVHSNLQASLIDVSLNAHFPLAEFHFLEKHSFKEKVLLGVVYKPPNASFGNELETRLYNFAPNYENIIVTGDINTNLNITNNQTKCLTSLFYYFGWPIELHSSSHQKATCSTRIDLFVVDHLNKISEFSQHSVSFFSSYDLIDIKYNLLGAQTLDGSILANLIFNFKNINVEELCHYLSENDRSSIYG